MAQGLTTTTTTQRAAALADARKGAAASRVYGAPLLRRDAFTTARESRLDFSELRDLGLAGARVGWSH